MSANPNSLLMISGPSGIGKTALVSGLIARWSTLYVRPLSYTSRPRREGEGDSEYQFVDKKLILDEFQRGNLANLDAVYENLYAIKKSSIDTALENGLSPIKEIHPSNHHKLRKLYPHCAAVLVLSDNDATPQTKPLADSRTREDAAFYSQLQHNDFEVITRSSRASGLDVFIEDTHFSIQAYLASRGQFPPPNEIDRQNADGYGKVAGRFTTQERPTTTNFHDLSAAFFAEAIGKIPEGSNCLETGSGQGWLRRNFQWPDVQYSTVDVAENMVATLEFEAKNSTRVAASVRSMPFPSATFDYVFSSLGDGYCYPTALAEIRRVLKKGGHFYFSAPSGVWASGLRTASAQDKTQFLLPSGDKAEVYSFALPIGELQKLITRCGLRVTYTEEVCGDKLPSNREISSALTESARKLRVPLTKLPTINIIAAIKD